MAFLANLDGDRVIPEQVSDDETVTCLSCGGKMAARGPSVDGRARHFVHHGGSDGCDGESDEHRKMKSLAVSKLRQEFGDEYTRCGPEVEFDVSHTDSSADLRRADALVEFDHPHSVYGSGLIVEVQFRNKGKEIPIVTRDYLECGYSVYWARPTDFTETEFLFEQLTSAFEASTTFAYSAPQFTERDLTTFEEFEDFDETDLHWEDPTPDCDHVWKEFDDFEYCARCRINRTYSTERTRFLYDNMGFLGPLERPDVPKVPDPPERNRTQPQDEEESSERGGEYGSWNPHGIPDCDHYRGPEHEWVDYGWADQRKAKCANCNVTVEKSRLGTNEVKDDISGWRSSSTDVPECDDSEGHEWIKTEILNRGRVQCSNCYMSVNRDRLSDSAEVDDLWE